MNEIDSRIVQLEFDNKEFEKNVQATVKSLEELKESLNLEENSKSLDALEKASKKISFDQVNSSLSNMEKSVDSIADKFTLMGTIGRKVIDGLADSILGMTKSAASFFTTAPIGGGFEKYTSKTKAMQTILSAVKEDQYFGDETAALADINTMLEELQWYADQTSYSFTDMVSSIGKFTAAGVDLSRAEIAVEGISNVAAKSGAGIQGAGIAMYNIAQAISKGYVQAQDWASIENANMATKEFKQQLILAAAATGALKEKVTKTGETVYTTAKGTVVSAESLRATLSEKWLDSESLIVALERYADRTTKFGSEAFAAAQNAITFTDAIEAIKDSMTTGWMQSFSIVFGDLNESIELWTGFCNAVIDVTSAIDEYRNAILQAWRDDKSFTDENGKKISSRTALLYGLADAAYSVVNVFAAIKTGIMSALGLIDKFGAWDASPVAKGLSDITHKIQSFGQFMAKTFGYETEVIEQIRWVDQNGNDVVGPIAEKEALEKGYKHKIVYEEVDNPYAIYDKELKKGSRDTKRKKLKTQKKVYDPTTGAYRLIDDYQEADDSVATLQKRLIDLNYLASGEDDGIFGPKTQKALKAFQKAQFLEENGIYDENTHKKLIAALEKEGKIVSKIKKPMQVIDTYYNRTKTAMTQAFENIGTILGGIMEAASQGLSFIFNLLEIAGKFVAPIINFGFSFVGILANIVGGVMKVVNSFHLIEGIGNAINITFTAIWSIFSELFSILSDIVSLGGSDILTGLFESLSSGNNDVTKWMDSLGQFAEFLKTGKSFTQWIRELRKSEDGLDKDTRKRLVTINKAYVGFKRTLSSIFAPLKTAMDPILTKLGEWKDALSIILGLSQESSRYDPTSGTFSGSVANNNVIEKVKLIKKEFADFISFMKTVGGSIGGFIISIPENLKKFIDWITNLFSKMKNGKKFKQNSEDTSKGIQSITDAVDDFFSLGFFKTLEVIWNHLTSFFGDLWTQISQSDTWTNVLNTLGDTFNSLWGVLTRVAQWLWTKFKTVWNILFPNNKIDDANSVADDVGGVAEDLGEAQTTLEKVLDWFDKHILSKFQALIDWLFPKKAEQRYDPTTGQFSSAIYDESGKLQEAGSFFETAWETIKDVFAKFMTWFMGLFGVKWDNPFTEVNEALEEGEETGENAKTIGEYLDQAFQFLKDTFGDIIEWIKYIFGISATPPGENPLDEAAKEGEETVETASWLSTAWDWVVDKLTTAWKAIQTFFSDIFGYPIKTDEDKGVEGGLNEGEKTVEEAVTFGDRVNGVIEWFKGIWEKVKNFIRNLFGLKDPTKATDEINEGIESGEETAENAITLSGIIDGVVKTLSDAWQGLIKFFADLFGLDTSEKKPTEEVDDTIDGMQTTAENARTVGSVVDGVVKFLSGIWLKVKTFIANLFGWEVPEEETPVSEAIGTLEGDTDQAETIGDKINAKIEKIKEVFNTVKQFISDFFTGLFGGNEKTEQRYDPTTGKFTEVEKSTEEYATIGEKIQGFIEKLIQVKDWAIEKIKSIGEFFSTLFSTIFGSNESGSDQNGSKEESETDKKISTAQSIGESIKGFLDKIGGFFSKENAEKIGEIINKVKDVVSTIWETITSIFGGNASAKTNNANKVETLSETGQKVMESVSGFIDTVNGVDKKAGKSSNFANIINTVINIAKSIGAFILLNSVFSILKSIGESFENVTSAFAAPYEIARWGGIALVIFAIANLLKTLSGMKDGTITAAVAIITIMSIALVALAFLETKFEDADAKVSVNRAVSMALTMAGFAAAVVILAAALKIISTIPPEKMLLSGAVLAGMLVAMLGFTYLAKYLKDVDWRSIASLSVIAGVVVLLAGAMKIISTISGPDIAKGLLTLALMFVYIGVFMKAMSKVTYTAGIDTAKIIATLGTIAGIIVVLTASIWLLSKLSWGDFVSGGAKLVILTGFVIAVVWALKIISRSAGELGAMSLSDLSGLWSIGLILIALSATMLILKGIDTKDFAVTLLKLVSIMMVLLMFFRFLPKIEAAGDAKKGLSVLLQMVGIALIIGVIAAAIYLLRNVDTGHIMTFGIIAVAVIGLCALLMKEVSFIGKFSQGFAGFMALLPIFLILGAVFGAIYILRDFDMNYIGLMLTGIVAVLGMLAILAVGVGLISKILDPRALITMAGLMISIGIVIAAIAFAVSYILTASPDNPDKAVEILTGIVDALKMIAILMTPLAIAAAAFTALGPAGIAGIAVACLGIAALIATLIVVGHAISAIDTVFNGAATKGIRKLGQFIGAFIEEIAAGFGKGLAKGLKSVKDANLSEDDLAKLTNTFNTVKGLYDSFSNVDFGTKLSNALFGSEFKNFSKDLVVFSEGMVELSNSVTDHEYDLTKIGTMVQAAELVKTLYDKFSGVSPSGLSRLFTTSTWREFIGTLGSFGQAMVELDTKINSIKSTGDFAEKIEPIISTAESIAALSKMFVGEDGKALELGKWEESSIFEMNGNGTYTLASGWIGFIGTLASFGEQMKELNSTVSTIDQKSANELRDKMAPLAAAAQSVADIFVAVSSVDQLTKEAAQAGQIVVETIGRSSAPSDLADQEGSVATYFSGDNWGRFIQSLPAFVTAVMNAGELIQDEIGEGKLDKKFKEKYIDPVAAAASGIAEIYVALGSVDLQPTVDQMGNYSFKNAGWSEFISTLVGDGTESNPGFANQMVEYAKIITALTTTTNASGKEVDTGLRDNKFTSISTNIVNAAKSIVELARAVAEADNTYGKNTGGIFNIGRLSLFGNNGLFAKFNEAIGGDMKGSKTNFGKAMQNYCELISGITLDNTKLPTNHKATLQAATELAQFISAIGGLGKDANGNSYKIDENTLKRKDDNFFSWVFGSDGVYYKFITAMGETADGKSIGKAMKSMIDTIDGWFGDEDLEENRAGEVTSKASKKIHVVMGMMTSIAKFISNMTNGTDEFEGIDEASIRTFSSFLDSLMLGSEARDALTGEMNSLGLVGAVNAIKNATDGLDALDGNEENIFVSKANIMLSVLRSMATFVAQFKEGRVYGDIYKVNSVYNFIDTVQQLIYAIQDMGKNADEDSVAYVNAVGVIFTRLSEVFSSLKALNSGEIDVNTMLSNLAGVVSAMNGDGIDTSKWTENFKSEEVVTAITTFSNTVSGSVSDATKTLSDALTSYQSTGEYAATTMANGISNGMTDAAAADGVASLASSVVTAMSGDSEGASQFKGVGSGFVSNIASGMVSSTAITKVTDAAKAAMDAALAAARERAGIHSPSTEMAKIGYYLDAGLAVGLKDSSKIAEIAAKKVAQEVVQATADESEVASPSKVFKALGMTLDESMASGIDSSTKSVTGSTRDLMNQALSAVSKMIENDVDAEPTIRPVMDLSEVRKSASLIGGMIPQNQTIGLSAINAAKKINASSALNNQNGSTTNNDNSNTSSISFAGANFNVRSDADIKNIAIEIASISRQEQQARGVLVY